MGNVRFWLLSEASLKSGIYTSSLVAAIFAAGTLSAHDMTELTVSSIVDNERGYVTVNVPDTQKDVPIVCAIYDADGGLLASDTWITDNLATQVVLRHKGVAVANAKCVLN